MQNKNWWIIIIILVLVGGLYMWDKSRKADKSGEDTVNIGPDEGRIVFSVTDAAADMGAVSEITIKINKVDVRSESAGWVNLSNSPKTFNLLDLKARSQSELLAEVRSKPGTYDRVRVYIESVMVKEKSGTVREAVLPSGNFDFNTKLVVRGGETSSVSLDFLADQSLYRSQSNQYVFSPVVKTETRSSADVSVDASGIVVIRSGTVDDSSTYGMNLDGAVKLNFRLDPATAIKIKADNTFDLEGILK